MSIWNKVFFVLILLCAAAFVYFGADALKMRRDSQKKLVEAQKALEDAKEKNRKLYFGTDQDDGYISLVNAVDRLRALRGTMAWPNCMPTAQALVNGTTVTVRLQVDALPTPSVTQPDDTQADDLVPDASPDPNSIDPGVLSEPVTPPQERVLPGSIVYLFEKRAKEDGGRLLGEFTVAKVENSTATLTNVNQMSDAEIARINDSATGLVPWAVYTVLPRTATTKPANFEMNEPVTGEPTTGGIEPGDDDSAEEILAVAKPQQSQELLTDPTDDLRPELAQTFVSLNQKRIRLLNLIDMQKKQQDALETTEMDAKKMIEYYQKEIEDCQVLHQDTLRQYVEVKKLYDATVEEVTNIKDMIASLKSLNKKMLADLTQAQLCASEIIHERDASLSMTY